MTPLVRDTTLVYQQEEQKHTLTVGTEAWYAWLETASTFSFVSVAGTFTARREQSGHKRGGWYWKAYRRQHGKLASRYLGKSETLTLERLQAIAAALASGEKPGVQGSNPLETTSCEPDTSSKTSPETIAKTYGETLLLTKFFIPPTAQAIVTRPRLVALLTEGVRHSLTLITAPAGCGKTTLLAEWRANPVGSAYPVACVSLDTGDNDPVRFWTYVMTALNTFRSGICDTTLAMIRSPQPPSLELVLITLLNVLTTISTDAVLVLDDYHEISAQPIHDTLTFLLDHLPPRLHFVIASRVDPLLPLARLRARGQLIELRAAELRFSRDEATEFLRDMMKLPLTESEIKSLETRTEGWIAGLQLAALSMQGRDNLSSFITAFSGSNRYIVDYLIEEVLKRQPEALQNFLLQTSLLDRLSGPLCDAVLDRSDSHELLESLERANLFIIPLDDERQWYRYHHLFAGMLKNLLHQTQPVLMPKLHRRACVWFEQHGLIDDAVQHTIAAHDIEQAARLIEVFGLSIALQGQVETVFSWLKRLPTTLVHTHPPLCLLHAVLLLFTDHLEEAESFLQYAEAAIGADLPTEQKQIFRGQIATVRTNILYYYGDVIHSVALARQALSLLPETEINARAPALLLAATAYLINGDVTPETERLVIEAVRPVRASGNVFAAFSSFTILARMYVLQGRLRLAAATFEEAVQVAPREEELQVLVGRPAYFIGVADLLREWNDLDSAERHMAQWMDMMKGTSAVDADAVTLGYTALARLKLARGEYRAASATLNALAQLAHRRHFAPHLLAHTAAVQAQMELVQGNLATALRWVDTSGLFIYNENPSYLQERAYLTLARIRIVQGRTDPVGPFIHDALDLLSRLLDDAQAKARMNSVLEIFILRALAFDARGNRTEALATLERTLLLAEPEGYIRIFIDEGKPMVALLRQAYVQGIAPGYVATLLMACGIQIAC